MLQRWLVCCDSVTGDMIFVCGVSWAILDGMKDFVGGEIEILVQRL